MRTAVRAKPAIQHRSREKRDRILAAMDRLLQRRPFSAISVADLAAEAGIPVATIYQRFSNREATASVLLELYFLRVEQWARRPRGSPAAQESLFEALRAIASDAIHQVHELGYIMRPAYLYSRQHPDLVGDDWTRLESMASEGFREFLARRADQVRVRDADTAAHFLACFYNFMLLGPLLHGDASSPLLKNPERLASELAVMAYRYLTCVDEAGESARR